MLFLITLEILIAHQVLYKCNDLKVNYVSVK